jgi:hypothetical protein
MRLALALLVTFGLLTAGGALAADSKAETDSARTVVVPDTAAAPHRVIACYFHTTKRCASCMKIEAYSQEAIEGAFADEIKNGRVVWRVVNVEEKGNEHFVKDYQLFTKSVVLIDEREGRQEAWKNLPKVWELLNDKNAFVSYVREETRAYLAEGRKPDREPDKGPGKEPNK